MRKILACAAAALLAAPALADLDLSALTARADALAAVGRVARQRRFNAIFRAFGSAELARRLVPPDPYETLSKALHRPDRAGLADDFAKIALAATTTEGGVVDRELRGDVSTALAAGIDALTAESAHLAQVTASLTAASDRARCAAAGHAGDGLSTDAAAARVAGRIPRCAALARRAAATYDRGVALAERLLDRQNRRGRKWSAPLTNLGGALLSVWTEPGPSPTVYVVGADDGSGPLFLRMGAEGWVRLPVAASGTLWWATGITGQVWAAGTGGRVVRYDPTDGSLVDVSVGVAVTLYGVWGSSPTDVWAVGGNSDGTRPLGAVYHYDGASWTNVEPDFESAGPTLFKVWGSAADDVWACGQGGTILHFDGTSWTQTTQAPFASLFTIHGSSPTIAVGGEVQPAIVEGGVAGFSPATIPGGANDLRGVFEPATGDAWACGLTATVLRRANGAWSRVAGVPATSTDFHAVSVDDDGGVYLVGGDLIGLDKGTLFYFGSRALPPANVVVAQAKLSVAIAPILSADKGALRPWGCAIGGCHVAASPSGSLDLFVDSHTMWTRLVSVPSSESTLLRVAPGRPSQSYLFQKLSGTQTGQGPSNERMPFGGPYLEQSDMDAVRAWILEGALDD